MSNTSTKTAVPDINIIPIIGNKNILIFSQEIHNWFDERKDFLYSIVDVPQYYDDFIDSEEKFMCSFMYDSTQYNLCPEKNEVMEKRWDSQLKHAQGIYKKALTYLDRIDYWKEKALVPKIRFSRRKTLNFLNPKNGEWQEYIPTRDTVWATASLKIYASCRQKGSSISPSVLYEYVRKEHPMPKWEPYASDPEGSLKRLRTTIQSANRWSEKHLSQQLFQCSKKGVKKLL